ncbi:pancreatic lipase-related protein 2-like [Argiope bruennichi]|uniref:pancreatic lipase-related protein 2-like n=1 Tax=Argiope bruennichi TaxID=94029 RepID=UPI002494970E|nr:pancreatic lipase-related protein 2-like [Argiope bruennichi]
MLVILVAALLVANPSFAIEPELDGDSNIYDSVVKSLQELKVEQLAEKVGVHLTPHVIQKADSVCYDELGCFDKEGTFKHLKQLPEPPESVNTQFLLYTRKNPHTPQFIDYKKPETIVNSNINPKLPLKVLTHGFGGKNNLTWLWEMKNAFIEMEDVNVIIIDWSLGARVPYYVAAAVNSELVGAQGAVLYYTIKDKLGIMEKDLHVVGFSLGAHVAGFFGKRMKELRGTRPGRITGLDPASPLFEDYGGEVHLYKDDGDFVDVIHTNADLLIYGGVGIEVPIGHVDFFPNGGKRQPGCGSTLKGALLDIFKGERERACNHERAVHLFTDSILNPNSCQYVGYPCSNYTDFQLGKCLSCDASTCGQMGYRPKGSGVYYMMTKPKKPFCAEVGKLTIRYPSTIKKSFGSMILTLVGGNGDKENITLSQKDEKLSPGGEKVLALPINDVMKTLSKVTALYLRYNGWFTKGAETFGLASVTITNSNGDYIFKSCDQNIILKDNEYQELKQTAATC